MEALTPYRARIDDLDDQIVDLLIERLHVIEEVAALKSRAGIPAVLQDRVEEVIDRCASRAAERGLDPALVRSLYAQLVSYCCRLEEDLMRDQPTQKVG